MTSGDNAPPSPRTSSPEGTVSPLPEAFGRFKVLQALGRGLWAQVFLCRDQETGRPVAVKIHARDIKGDPAKALGRFQNEIEVLQRVNHPNVARVLEVGMDDGRPWLAMEVCEGPSLQRLMTHQGAFPPARAAWVLRELASTVDYLHSLRIVHRDLKPSNMMFDQGHIKLTDFGVVHVEHRQLTLVGEAVGTPLYMAPEQIEGKTLDHRADLYALGVSLFTMLAGRPPFEGKPLALLAAKVRSQPPRLTSLAPHLPQALDAYFERALAREPRGRFNSAAEMYAEFKRASGQSQVEPVIIPEALRPEARSFELPPALAPNPGASRQTIRLAVGPLGDGASPPAPSASATPEAPSTFTAPASSPVHPEVGRYGFGDDDDKVTEVRDMGVAAPALERQQLSPASSGPGPAPALPRGEFAPSAAELDRSNLPTTPAVQVTPPPASASAAPDLPVGPRRSPRTAPTLPAVPVVLPPLAQQPGGDAASSLPAAGAPEPGSPRSGGQGAPASPALGGSDLDDDLEPVEGPTLDTVLAFPAEQGGQTYPLSTASPAGQKETTAGRQAAQPVPRETTAGRQAAQPVPGETTAGRQAAQPVPRETTAGGTPRVESMWGGAWGPNEGGGGEPGRSRASPIETGLSKPSPAGAGNDASVQPGPKPDREKASPSSGAANGKPYRSHRPPTIEAEGPKIQLALAADLSKFPSAAPRGRKVPLHSETPTVELPREVLLQLAAAARPIPVPPPGGAPMPGAPPAGAPLPPASPVPVPGAVNPLEMPPLTGVELPLPGGLEGAGLQPEGVAGAPVPGAILDGEVRRAPGAKKRLWLVLAALVAVVVIGLAGLMTLRGSRVLGGRDLAMVQVFTEPAGAIIENDEGRSLGEAPLNAPVRIQADGTIGLSAHMAGYLPQDQRQPAQAGSTVTFRFVLEPSPEGGVPEGGEPPAAAPEGRKISPGARGGKVLYPQTAEQRGSLPSRSPTSAYLLLESTPEGEIVVDGRSLGRTNTGEPLRLSPGEHTLLLTTPDGSRPVTRKLSLKSGQTLRLSYDFLDKAWRDPRGAP